MADEQIIIVQPEEDLTHLRERHLHRQKALSLFQVMRPFLARMAIFKPSISTLFRAVLQELLFKILPHLAGAAMNRAIPSCSRATLTVWSSR